MATSWRVFYEYHWQMWDIFSQLITQINVEKYIIQITHKVKMQSIDQLRPNQFL